MPGKIINVSVLGIGFSANVFHIPYILSLQDIYKLHSIYERRATPNESKARDKYGYLGVKVVNTLEAVLTDAEVDLVVVTVKDPAHYEYAKATLEAGKHVVLEKPVTATSEEVHDLIEIAKQHKVVFAPYHNRRFDGDFRTVRKLIQEGKVTVHLFTPSSVTHIRSQLPNLVDFESRYDVRADWGPAPPGGSAGITYGLGSHLIDQAIALFGKPMSVTAVLDNGRKVGHPDVDDSFIIHLRYADKPTIVTLRSALHSVASHQIRFIARSLNCSYVKYGLDVQEPQIAFQGMKPLDKGFGEETEEAYGEYAEMVDGKPKFTKVPTEKGVYIEYYRNVGETILGKTTLEVTGEHAELGIKIIELAHQSHKEQRTIELQ
ncbi:hypothetical protein NM688_g1268 [Phlebia brevispora]|uniref:Uncharacterized protein n=1 Tax=Phlebia brevispora TaxID=194682 RepID=A0ACC1TBV5_9APHY|nr:hypothetical protein NM688_g1268 [Phlebia brevispora]